MNNKDCVFCKIVAGEIPSTCVYSDEHIYAFYDADPKAPIHFLVIPKEHIQSAADINADNSTVIGHIFQIISKLAKEMNLNNGFRVVTNCGTTAGQSVPHLHFHVLSGRAMTWPPG